MSQELLEKILDMLHVDKIGREIEYVHNMIREKWTVKHYRAKNYDDCHRYLSKYYQYHYSSMAAANVHIPESMAYGRVREILDKGQGGYVGSIKNAIRGREGGLITLINLIAEGIKQEATEKYITYIIGTYVSPLDFPLKTALMRRYLNRYGKKLLRGDDMMSPEELASNFDSVIKYHVQMVNQYRNVLQ